MKSKNYKIKPTKKQLIILRKGWKTFQEILDAFHINIFFLEKQMSKETGIKDLEFFQSDGDWCGIGNGDRTMKLFQREELE